MASAPSDFPLTRKNALQRPHSQRFCDVTVTVKFYCKCDVAKSFRMGPQTAAMMQIKMVNRPDCRLVDRAALTPFRAARLGHPGENRGKVQWRQYLLD